MKKLELTKNQYAIIDDSDYKYYSQWKWTALKTKNTYYAVRTDYSSGKMKYIYLHREIMQTPIDMECDHQDHNGLNCQRYNLRNCIHAQNVLNSSSHRDSASKYKGVSIFILKYKLASGDIKSTNPRWRATISRNKKLMHIGCFDTEEEAALAYNQAALKHHGEFANLNQISV